jgi:MFS family permease
MLDVLLVVLAIRVLGLGPSGPGYLTAAFGAGGVLGSFATVSLIGRQRLVSPLLAAGFASAALLVALGGWTTAVGAFLMLPAAGLARSLLDVCGRTMLLQSAPADHRGRIFGLLESVAMAGLALGSLSVPLFTAAGGTRASLIVTGSLLSVITVVAAVPLTREVAGLAERQAVPAVDA